MSEHFMQRALELAQLAEQQGEVPVGALVVQNNEIIAEGYNQVISKSDPSAHAEVVALKQAGLRLSNYRLTGCDLYVTLEPCLMCVGAIVHARINCVYYAAADPKTGCVDSCCQLFESPYHNHQVKHHAGLLAEQSSALLKAFFKARR